jgi:hypothetical protein
VGAVMGAMFLVGGAGVLAFNGFKDMLAIIKGIPSSIDEIKNADFKGIGDAIRTGVGAVVIAIGFMTTATAIKDFFDSDEEGSLKNTLKASGGILEMIGGIRILKGQKGGYIMALVGFAMDEQSQNRLLSDFGRLSSYIEALFLTLGDGIKNIFSSSVHDSIAKIWNDILASMGPMGAILGLSPIGMNGLSTFDFGATYKTNYRAQRKHWDELQVILNDFMYGDIENNDKMSSISDAPTQQEWMASQPRTYNYYIQGYDLQEALDIVKRDS